MISDFLLKLIIGGGLAILVALGVRNYFATMQENRQLTSEVEQADRTGVATTGILEDINSGQTETQRVEVIVHEVRTEYQRDYRAARDADPDIAVWGDGRIPQRVRDLARERRLDRENRSRRAGDGSGDDGEAPGAGG